SKPVANTSGSGIVRGCRKPKISKFTTQVTQQLTGLRDRFERIERIFKAIQSSRCRHELSDALCTFPADRVRLEATFLPDQASEEIDRQIIGRCRRGERLAKARCGRWSARVIGGCRWSALVRLVILFRLVIFFGLAVFSGGLLLHRIIANVRCESRRP